MVGTFRNVVQDFDVATALGVIRNSNGVAYETVNKFGSQTDVDPANNFVFVSFNQRTAFWQTAPIAVRVAAGGNAADTVAGANAQKVMVTGLDSNGDRATEEIELAGALASAATTTEWWRVERAFVTDVGTYNASNAEAITIETTGGDSILNIPANLGQSLHAAFSVPRGYTCLIREVVIGIDDQRPMDIRLLRRNRLDVTSSPGMQATRIWREYKAAPAGLSNVLQQYEMFPELTDIWAEAQANSVNAEVSVDFEALFIPNF
jgi:hypothetical protein